MNKVVVIEKMDGILEKAKDMADIGIRVVTASEELICRAVALLAGLLLGTLCSKQFKKIAWLIAALTGIGAAYLIYRRFAKD